MKWPPWKKITPEPVPQLDQWLTDTLRSRYVQIRDAEHDVCLHRVVSNINAVGQGLKLRFPEEIESHIGIDFDSVSMPHIGNPPDTSYEDALRRGAVERVERLRSNSARLRRLPSAMRQAVDDWKLTSVPTPPKGCIYAGQIVLQRKVNFQTVVYADLLVGFAAAYLVCKDQALGTGDVKLPGWQWKYHPVSLWIEVVAESHMQVSPLLQRLRLYRDVVASGVLNVAGIVVVSPDARWKEVICANGYDFYWLEDV